MGSNEKCPDCGNTVAVIEGKFVPHDDATLRKTCRRSKKPFIFKSFYLGVHGPSRDGDVDEINLVVSDVRGAEGCLYEFGIVLHQFREGRFALQARVFSDAWEAFRDCPEVFQILSEHDTRYPRRATEDLFDEIVNRLVKAGWKNDGRKSGRYLRICEECGREVIERGAMGAPRVPKR